MTSVKDLQDAAAKEHARAESERKEAQRHREKASNFRVSDDPRLPLRENDQAQNAEKQAQQHEKQASDLIQQATNVEKDAVALEEQARKLRGQ